MSDRIFKIHGFEVRKDSIYKIEDKPDLDAPSGFISEGVTKLPDETIDESIQCRYLSDSNNPGEGIWDTGFYTSSPCYRDKPESEVVQIVETLNTEVVEPYERAFGLEKLNNNNDKFWNNHNVSLYKGRVFNTANIRDLLDLFIALNSYSLTPKGQEGDPKFARSPYVVVDKALSTEFKNDLVERKFAATSSFITLLNSDKKRLLACLSYLKLNFGKSASSTTLMTSFNDYLESEASNAGTFNDLIEKTNTKKGLDEVFIYSSLKSQFDKGIVKKGPGGMIYFENTEVGADLKDAAENISSKKDFSEIKKEILLGD